MAKIIPFPGTKPIEEGETNKDNVEDSLKDSLTTEIIWECKVCGYEVLETERTTKEGPLGIGIGGLPVTICPNCFVLSILLQVFEQLKEQLTSKIIKPGGPIV